MVRGSSNAPGCKGQALVLIFPLLFQHWSESFNLVFLFGSVPGELGTFTRNCLNWIKIQINWKNGIVLVHYSIIITYVAVSRSIFHIPCKICIARNVISYGSDTDYFVISCKIIDSQTKFLIFSQTPCVETDFWKPQKTQARPNVRLWRT